MAFPLTLYVTVEAGAPPDLFKDMIPLPKAGWQRQIQSKCQKIRLFSLLPRPKPLPIAAVGLSPLPAASRSR